MMKEAVLQKMKEFDDAIYGEDVKRTYIDMARMVCIEAMEKLDGAVEQGNFAESQGNYAKNQGNYAEDRGKYAEQQADAAVLEAKTCMTGIQKDFNTIKDIINSTGNGELLLEIKELLDDMYRRATESDIENIISGTYADEDEQGSIFETGTNEDIDDILSGGYVENEEDGDSASDEEIKNMIDSVFK